MTYKTGETPQKNDEVLGTVDGKPARGRVIVVLGDDKVKITRRAATAPGQPLAAEHVEVAASDLTLIYRPRQVPSTPPAPSTASAAERERRITARAKAAAASKKEAVKK